jgi:hypothetical protein
MPAKPQLNPEVLTFLHEKLGKSISTIRSDLSRLKRDYPTSSLNAVAQIYAEKHGESVRRLIGKADKLLIPVAPVVKQTVVRRRDKLGAIEKKRTIIQFVTDDIFLKKHIDEINRAYNKNCYTCVFVLTRKVFENLIVRILKARFPTNPELHLDIANNRNQDFSVVLDNLYRNRSAFDGDKQKAIERLHQKLKPFKNDANDKVHSLYHIVENAKEVEDWNLDTVIGLITEIMS